MIIESKNNSRLKEWKKLQTKKGRKESGLFIIEGEHLVEEAMKSNWPIVDLIVSDTYQAPRHWETSYPILMQEKIVLASALFPEISETQTPQGVAAIIKKRSEQEEEKWLTTGNLLLMVDHIQDPGNLGTMIRTADAAGVDAIILGRGTVDSYSGKVLRSSQGSTFHLPIVEKDLLDYIHKLKDAGWTIIGTSLQEAEDYRNLHIQNDSKIAIVMGNEGEGIDSSILELVDQKVKIPIWGAAESLNVAIATGILLYHIQGQYKNKL